MEKGFLAKNREHIPSIWIVFIRFNYIFMLPSLVRVLNASFAGGVELPFVVKVLLMGSAREIPRCRKTPISLSQGKVRMRQCARFG